MVARALMGLSSAGGSVTLGMIADMWEPEEQQFAVAYVVLSSVAGSVVAPIVGGPITEYLDWTWVFWVSLIFGVVAQGIHFFTPETRSDVLLDKHAKMLRETGQDKNVYGPNEIKGSLWQRLTFKEVATLMFRPYKFMYTEPIVLFLSLLSGFSDALIFAGLDSFPLVLAKWDFSVIATGLAFIPLLIGYILAYASFLPVYWRDRKQMRTDRARYPPERRLWWLCYLVPLEPIGLLLYGLCSYFAPDVHWIAPMFCSGLIGIANFAIYMATIDYMIAAYGPFSASATGSNGFFRDFLAGIAALYTRPMYTNFAPGTRLQLAIPAWILTGIGILLCIPVYVFYVKGEWFRKRSVYAQQLAHERDDRRQQRDEAIRSLPTSPTASRLNSRPGSRAQSPSRRRPAANNGLDIMQLDSRLSAVPESEPERVTETVELKSFSA